MYILKSILIKIMGKIIKHLYIINNYTLHVVLFYYNYVSFSEYWLREISLFSLPSNLSVSWVLIYEKHFLNNFHIYICTVQYSHHWQHVISKHLRCGHSRLRCAVGEIYVTDHRA